jgi:hypothetical protein
MSKHIFWFWDEQWQENTEQETQQGGGASSPTYPKEDDSKTSRR